MEHELLLASWEQASVSSVSYQWFSCSQVIASHACPVQHSAEDSRGTLCGSRELCLSAAPSFVALCPANSNHAGLPGLLFPIVTIGLTSFVSCFSRIIHCLMSKFLKALFHIFSNDLVISVWRVNPALVTPSWPEVPFSLMFKFLYILRIPTLHLSYILQTGSYI